MGAEVSTLGETLVAQGAEVGSFAGVTADVDL